MRRLLILLAALAAAALSAAPAFAGKRVALVIGNNDYRNVPKLQKAVNDARSMGDALKSSRLQRHGGREPDPAGL